MQLSGTEMCQNVSLIVKSDKGTFIISGSEDQQVYMWETNDPKKSNSRVAKIANHDYFKGKKR
jgi:hypothetical protein